ncbi:MAG: response regulator, partial [Coleofasciculaceae cyanobacterium SM2_1_6]|nr:response regulator [Coleofasciculaceae cyanobacterium SM2_1_6]
PLYDENQQIIGSIGVEKRLSEISDFLKTIQGSPSMRIFILERDGLLVADSSNEEPFKLVEEQAIRIPGTASKDPLIQATAKYLEQKFGQFQNIQGSQQLFFWRDGQKQFIKLNSWQDAEGLDWLVVIVVSEADFMARINANNNLTILLCLLSLIVTTGLGIITAQWITIPVKKINEASGSIAQGELQPVVATGGIRELTALAKSFNMMVHQLQISFETLEQRVTERTTELAIAKEKAEIANHAKSTFIANMSHELRSPLNAIMGFSQLMQHTPNLPEEQYENADIIYRSGDYLLTLINNILDLSKIEANKTTLNIQEFNLHNLLDDLEAMLQLRASSANLSLIFERSPEVPVYICTDDIKLRQVLLNLLTNAIKFTEQGAIVLSVDCAFPENSLEDQEGSKKITLYFSVRDTGVGIAPEELAYVFEAFTQAEAGRARQEGTGLGLTISRKFIQLMGGDISLESTLGQGSTFQFQIQAALGTGENHASLMEAPRSRRHRSILGLAPGQPLYRILIVDDKPINRQLLIKMLNPLGFQLREASNGEEAIKLWATWYPHLIWMDIRMPGMDGYTATKHIRATPQGAETIIIALTASVLEEEKYITFASGCNDFLPKPFREQDIFEALAKYLGVQYIYAEDEPKIAPAFTLTPEQLACMPQAWIKQLYKAAIEGDVELILSLIKEIPATELELAQNLKELVQQFPI